MPIDKLLLGLLLVVTAAIVVRSVIQAVRGATDWRRGWEAFARDTPGFSLLDSGGLQAVRRLVGSMGDVHVEAIVMTRGTSGTYRFATRVTASREGTLPRDLVLVPRHSPADIQVFERLAGVFTYRVPTVAVPILTGDPALDSSFLATAESEATVRAVVSRPAVRDALLTAYQREPRLAIVDGHVIVERPGQIHTQRDLQSMIDASASIVRAAASPNDLAARSTR
jgi:hypothetical protein